MNRRGVCSGILRPIGITGSLKRSIVFVGSLNAAERVRAQLTYALSICSETEPVSSSRPVLRLVVIDDHQRTDA